MSSPSESPQEAKIKKTKVMAKEREKKKSFAGAFDKAERDIHQFCRYCTLMVASAIFIFISS
jgi:hypothetical protein